MGGLEWEPPKGSFPRAPRTMPHLRPSAGGERWLLMLPPLEKGNDLRRRNPGHGPEELCPRHATGTHLAPVNASGEAAK